MFKNYCFLLREYAEEDLELDDLWSDLRFPFVFHLSLPIVPFHHLSQRSFSVDDVPYESLGYLFAINYPFMTP